MFLWSQFSFKRLPAPQNCFFHKEPLDVLIIKFYIWRKINSFSRYVFMKCKIFKICYFIVDIAAQWKLLLAAPVEAQVVSKWDLVKY